MKRREILKLRTYFGVNSMLRYHEFVIVNKYSLQNLYEKGHCIMMFGGTLSSDHLKEKLNNKHDEI